MAKIAPIPPIQPSRGQVGGGKKKWTNGQNNVVPFPKNGQNQTPFHIDPILLVEKRIEKIKLTGYKNHLEKLKKLHGENNIAPFSRREAENQAEISTIPEVVSTVPEIKSENISAKNEAVVEPKTQTPKKDVLEKKQENLIKVEQKLETQREATQTIIWAWFFFAMCMICKTALRIHGLVRPSLSVMRRTAKPYRTCLINSESAEAKNPIRSVSTPRRRCV